MIIKKRGRPRGKPNFPQAIYRIKNPKEVGDMVRKARRGWGMTQAYLAGEVGCTASFISQLERGVCRTTPDMIKKIFTHLKLEE